MGEKLADGASGGAFSHEKTEILGGFCADFYRFWHADYATFFRLFGGATVFCDGFFWR